MRYTDSLQNISLLKKTCRGDKYLESTACSINLCKVSSYSKEYSGCRYWAGLVLKHNLARSTADRSNLFHC